MRAWISDANANVAGWRSHNTAGTCTWDWSPGTEQGCTGGQEGLGLIYFLHAFCAMSDVFYFSKQ